MTLKKLVAEFIGTFALVFAGTGAIVVNETSGSWGNAIEVPGTAGLNGGGNAHVNSVSCPTAGKCTAGGYYTDGSLPTGHPQAFVVDQKDLDLLPARGKSSGQRQHQRTVSRSHLHDQAR